jgi:hypothetical protein
MRGVNRRYEVPHLKFPFALDTFGSSTIETFLLKVWRCMQIEYNDWCGSDTQNADDVARGTHKLVRIRRNLFPAHEYLRT